MYYGVGLTRSGLGSGLRGGKLDVVGIPGFWLDVDLKGPGHKAQNLPEGLEGGAAMLELCPFAPTAVVDSGRGLHAYWLFDHFFPIESGQHERINNVSKAFQQRIIDAAAAQGFHLDQTGNIDRVLRLPGLMNYKVAGDPRPTRALFADGPRFDMRVLAVGPASKIQVQVSAAARAPASTIDPNDALADLKRKLQHLKNMGNRMLMREVLAGRSFATEGGRDAMLQKLASIVAFIAPPGSDPAALAEIFRPSLDAMATESNDPDNPCPTFEHAVDKIERALQDAERKRAADADFRSAFVKGPPTSSEARSDGAHTPEGSLASDEGPGIDAGMYTPDDLKNFSTSQDTTDDDFKKRWIIQHTNAFYVFYNGTYLYPIPKEVLPLSLRDDLAPAEKLGVTLWTFKTDGNPRKMTVPEILDAYGTRARQARGSLMLSESTYDPKTQIFWEAMCPPRPITPRFDQAIDTWLRLLGGAEADQLLNWIAALDRLDVQNSALYLSGKAGAGKTLLAHGLARRWTEAGPTELSDVVGGAFNAGISKCPLVFGDEAMHCSTAELRRLVGSSAHTLKRKYLPNVELDGALRVILADNGGRMLIRDREEISGDDLDAVACKFLHIAVEQDPVDYLRSIGGRSGTSDWVTGDKIAAHALWLAQTRQFVPGGRFIVEGHVTSMTRLLATQGTAPGLVCEWIVSYLDRPIPNIAQQKTAIVGGGKILINVDAISIHWGDYVHSERQAMSKARIGSALRNLSSGTKRVGTKRYHDVRPELILEWSEKNLVSDPLTLRAKVEAPLPDGISIDEVA